MEEEKKKTSDLSLHGGCLDGLATSHCRLKAVLVGSTRHSELTMEPPHAKQEWFPRT